MLVTIFPFLLAGVHAILPQLSFPYACKGSIIDLELTICKYIQDYVDGVSNLDCMIITNTLTEDEIKDEMREAEHIYCNDSSLRNQLAESVGEMTDSSDAPGVTFDVLSGYGCWCNLADNDFNGHGTPMNALDASCKDIVEGYRCINMDAAADPNYDADFICDSNFNGYYVALTQVADMTTTEQCRIFNEAVGDLYEWNASQLTCAYTRCETDAKFLVWMMTSALDENYSFEYMYIWEEFGGSFRPEDFCHKADVQSGPAQTCCGTYPDRVPIYSGNAACCNNQFRYHPRMEECCQVDDDVFEIVPKNTCMGEVIEA